MIAELDIWRLAHILVVQRGPSPNEYPAQRVDDVLKRRSNVSQTALETLTSNPREGGWSPSCRAKSLLRLGAYAPTDPREW